MKNKNDFEFNYSAPTLEERKKIESIRNSYLNKNNSPNSLGYLRKLDNKVKSIPQIVGLVFGTVGVLVFGLGLAMILEWFLYLWGVVVCVIGLVPMLLAYPLNIKATKILKDKYQEEIITLSNELLSTTDETKKE